MRIRGFEGTWTYREIYPEILPTRPYENFFKFSCGSDKQEKEKKIFPFLRPKVQYEFKMGDLNDNGKIDKMDIFILKTLLEKAESKGHNLTYQDIPEEMLWKSDFDQNGSIDYFDLDVLHGFLDLIPEVRQFRVDEMKVPPNIIK